MPFCTRFAFAHTPARLRFLLLYFSILPRLALRAHLLFGAHFLRSREKTGIIHCMVCESFGSSSSPVSDRRGTGSVCCACAVFFKQSDHSSPTFLPILPFSSGRHGMCAHALHTHALCILLSHSSTCFCTAGTHHTFLLTTYLGWVLSTPSPHATFFHHFLAATLFPIPAYYLPTLFSVPPFFIMCVVYMSFGLFYCMLTFWMIMGFAFGTFGLAGQDGTFCVYLWFILLHDTPVTKSLVPSHAWHGMCMWLLCCAGMPCSSMHMAWHALHACSHADSVMATYPIPWL